MDLQYGNFFRQHSPSTTKERFARFDSWIIGVIWDLFFFSSMGFSPKIGVLHRWTFYLRGFTSPIFAPFFFLFSQRTLGKGDNTHWNELSINSDVLDLDLASPFIPGIPLLTTEIFLNVDFYIINTKGYIHTPCWHLKGEAKKGWEIFWLQNGKFGF